MPKLVDARVQRAEIRDAARRVFSRRGVAGTGLAHVAAAAGMGRSSLYHYYPDKASLLRDLVRDLLREEEAIFLDALRGAGAPLERIERLVERQAQIGPSARHDDLASAGLAGDADLLVAVSVVSGRATGDAHVDQIAVPGAEKLDPRLGIRPILDAQCAESLPVNLHRLVPVLVPPHKDSRTGIAALPLNGVGLR